MIVASVEVKSRQTKTKINRLKSTTLLLWLKIKKEDKKSYESKIFIRTKDNFFLKDHTTTTQKQTKITLSTHKLHRVQSVT